MTKVTQVDANTYDVVRFVACMPHLDFRVRLINGKLRVVIREGTHKKIWDKHAISAVQKALILGEVR